MNTLIHYTFSMFSFYKKSVCHTSKYLNNNYNKNNKRKKIQSEEKKSIKTKMYGFINCGSESITFRKKPTNVLNLIIFRIHMDTYKPHCKITMVCTQKTVFNILSKNKEND